MAYINGQEILFSANVNIAAGGIKRETLSNDNEPLIAQPNTVYIADVPITELQVDLPIDDISICSFIFEVGENYDIRFFYDAGEIRYIGKAPDFQIGETWELNIMNGIIASGKVVSE